MSYLEKIKNNQYTNGQKLCIFEDGGIEGKTYFEDSEGVCYIFNKQRECVLKFEYKGNNIHGMCIEYDGNNKEEAYFFCNGRRI